MWLVQERESDWKEKLWEWTRWLVPGTMGVWRQPRDELYYLHCCPTSPGHSQSLLACVSATIPSTSTLLSPRQPEEPFSWPDFSQTPQWVSHRLHLTKKRLNADSDLWGPTASQAHYFSVLGPKVHSMHPQDILCGFFSPVLLDFPLWIFGLLFSLLRNLFL